MVSGVVACCPENRKAGHSSGFCLFAASGKIRDYTGLQVIGLYWTSSNWRHGDGPLPGLSLGP